MYQILKSLFTRYMENSYIGITKNKFNSLIYAVMNRYYYRLSSFVVVIVNIILIVAAVITF